MISRRLALVLLLAAVYLPSAGLTQEQTDEGKPELSISSPDSAYKITAGKSRLRVSDGERVLELTEGVRIVHGDVVITSDWGRHYTQRKFSYLFGAVNIDQDDLHMESEEGEYHRLEDMVILRYEVKIVDRGWTITCDEAVYFRDHEISVLRGNVMAVDSATTLWADSLFYDTPAALAEAFGNVRMVNNEKAIELTGRHGIYNRNNGEGTVDEDPVLIADPDAPEPVTVISDTMHFYPDDNRAIANGRVKIVKGNTITQCDSAILSDSEQRVELYGAPLAQQENMSMAGDRMILHYDDENVNQIDIAGQAALRETPLDTLVINRDNWVQGDSMQIYVHNNRLDSLRVVGEASSEYYPGSVDKVERNEVTGDRMFFLFQEDSLTYVRVIGTAEGVYSYLNVRRNETVDSLRAIRDTSLVYVDFREKASNVAYKADTIQYFAKDRDLYLNSKSKVDYENKTLLADQIAYNADLQMLDASGSPVLIEGPEKFYGDQMDYDLEEGIGLVQDGSTKFLEGYYQGKDVAKVGDDVLKMWKSTYTTCDRKVPHYHFASRQMKVYLDDKVVTGPVALYVGETPVFALPFFAENIRRGRRSGILRPDFEFGINTRDGRFVRNIGYYWATNDYMDFTFVGDFNENSSARLAVLNRYRKRYSFDGDVDYTYVRDLQQFSNSWTLDARHNHTLGEKFSFTSDLQFLSDDNARRAVSRIDEVEDIVNREVRSRISLRKSWDIVGFSASAQRNQILNVNDEDLSAQKVFTVLPNVTLSIPSRSLYFGERTTRGDAPFIEALLDGIRYSPGLSFNRTKIERPKNFSETVTANASLSFSSPQRVGFINVSPSLAMTDVFTRTVNDTDARWIITENPPDTVVGGPFPQIVPVTLDSMFAPASRFESNENEFNWNFGVGANTNFFGTFYPEVALLRGVRHTVTPSVSYSFRPGKSGRPASESISMSLRNAIDLKVLEGEEERKLSGIFLWNLSTSYNPNAAGRQGWSNISSNLNLKVLGTGISVNQSIEPYDWELLNTSVTSGFDFRGRHRFGSSAEIESPELNIIASDTTDTSADADTTQQENYDVTYDQETGFGAGTGGDAGGQGDDLTWNLSLSVSYYQPSTGDPRSTLNLNGSINLTRSWRLTYSTQLDVIGKDQLGQRFEVTRNLHCWEMSFIRQQLADEWEFYFKINLLAHPEVYTQQGNRGLQAGGFSSYNF